MTLKRGKEILQKEEEDTFMGSHKEWKAAVRIDIEAIDRLETLRAYNIGAALDLLPGETKD